MGGLYKYNNTYPGAEGRRSKERARSYEIGV